MFPRISAPLSRRKLSQQRAYGPQEAALRKTHLSMTRRHPAAVHRHQKAGTWTAQPITSPQALRSPISYRSCSLKTSWPKSFEPHRLLCPPFLPHFQRLSHSRTTTMVVIAYVKLTFGLVASSPGLCTTCWRGSSNTLSVCISLVRLI
jgi:hypothetical protein